MTKIINEPLQHFLDKHGVDVSKIDRIVCGRKYSAVRLKNGHTGVCANLLTNIDFKIEDLKRVDIHKTEHRILLNAYFNALLNQENHYRETVDIFAGVDFKSYGDIVMIGLFKPLLEKFKNHHINVRVFDKIKKDEALEPMQNKSQRIKTADAVILSATTIFNGTFREIVSGTKEKCDIFLLGPSAILHRDMFAYKNIKKIFGSIFTPFDDRVLETIKKGHGTREFARFARKVSLSK